MGKYHLVNFLFKALFFKAFILKSQMFWVAFHFCQGLLHFGTFLYFFSKPRIHEWDFLVIQKVRKYQWVIFLLKALLKTSLTPLWRGNSCSSATTAVNMIIMTCEIILTWLDFFFKQFCLFSCNLWCYMVQFTRNLLRDHGILEV